MKIWIYVLLFLIAYSFSGSAQIFDACPVDASEEDDVINCPSGYSECSKEVCFGADDCAVHAGCCRSSCGGLFCSNLAPDGTPCCGGDDDSAELQWYIAGTRTCPSGVLAYTYGCCPADAEKYNPTPTSRIEACCISPNKVCVEDDGTKSCKASCCKDGEVPYISSNGIEYCCDASEVLREKEGVALCCEASEDIAKNDAGEYVCCDKASIKDGKCEGCPDGEKAYVNGAGESACCAGELYNCNDEDGDGVTTCECCPKCTGKDDNGEWVPAGCGEVKDE